VVKGKEFVDIVMGLVMGFVAFGIVVDVMCQVSCVVSRYMSMMNWNMGAIDFWDVKKMAILQLWNMVIMMWGRSIFVVVCTGR
jgi:hypothetical protein